MKLITFKKAVYTQAKDAGSSQARNRTQTSSTPCALRQYQNKNGQGAQSACNQNSTTSSVNNNDTLSARRSGVQRAALTSASHDTRGITNSTALVPLTTPSSSATCPPAAIGRPRTPPSPPSQCH
eukprot:TRINITY_DN6758_c0_g1_i4.p2 TRINITY_DN6758_c0_g1~~TRINITY_DN6758_c0_g1_i4.p2  ORF type:complete len:125 (+),score=4.25 TRINITY_DN6758_c0_g1_i4:151-525(+)